MFLLSNFNTSIVRELLTTISPTLNFEVGQIASLPLVDINPRNFTELPKLLIAKTKKDWDSYETSWDFAALPLLQSDYRQQTLKDTYEKLRSQWREMTLEMQKLEEENNRIFIEAYGLQGELTPEVPLQEITLTCNPHCRYGKGLSEEQLEALLLADTAKEFISYAVGCMFGRYALEKPGLILTNQDEARSVYLKQLSSPLFPPCGGNILPLLECEGFIIAITQKLSTLLELAVCKE